MFSAVFVIHILICLGIMGLVLVQQGKGADAGAVFGSGSDAVVGAGSAPDFITKLTTGMAIAFMVTSVLLVKSYMTLEVGTSVEDTLEGSVVMADKVDTVPASGAESAGVVASDNLVVDAAQKVDTAPLANQAEPAVAVDADEVIMEKVEIAEVVEESAPNVQEVQEVVVEEIVPEAIVTEEAVTAEADS